MVSALAPPAITSMISAAVLASAKRLKVKQKNCPVGFGKANSAGLITLVPIRDGFCLPFSAVVLRRVAAATTGNHRLEQANQSTALLVALLR